MVSSDMLSFYAEITEYFKKELGFPPFQPIPDSIRVNKADSIIRGKESFSLISLQSDRIWENNPDGKVLLHLTIHPFPTLNSVYVEKIFVAIEAILSFIPETIRDLPLMHAMVLYRLANGASPLDERMKKTAVQLFSIYRDVYEGAMANDKIMLANLSAIAQILPEGYVEQIFVDYLYAFANVKDFLTKDNVLVNAIIEDAATKYNLFLPLNTIETYLLHHLSDAFNAARFPLSPEKFLKYLNDHIDQKSPLYSQLVPYLSLEGINQYYTSIHKRGISFILRTDYTTLGFILEMYVIEVNPSIDKALLSRCFENLESSISVYSNFESEGIIQTGVLFKGDGNFKMFFESMQSQGIIKRYWLIPYANYEYFFNLPDLADFKHHISSFFHTDKIWNITSRNAYKNKKLHAPDPIDFVLFRVLFYIGANGFWLEYRQKELAKRFRKGIESEKNALNSEIVIQMKRLKDLKSPIPHKYKDLFAAVFSDSKVDLDGDLLDLLQVIEKQYGRTRTLLLFDSLKHFDWDLVSILAGGKHDKLTIEKIYKSLLPEEFDLLNETIEYFRSKRGVGIDGLSFKVNSLTEYLEKSDTDMEKDLFSRIATYAKLGILIPSLPNSVFTPDYTNIVIVVLKNISEKDPRLDYIANRISTGYMHQNRPYTLMHFRFHPNQSEIIYHIVSTLFKGQIELYVNIIGYPFMRPFSIDQAYNPRLGRYMDMSEPLQGTIEAMSLYKERFGFKHQDSRLKSDDAPKMVEETFDPKYFDQLLKEWWQRLEKPAILPSPTAEMILTTARKFLLLGSNPHSIPQNPERSSRKNTIHYTAFPNITRLGLTYYIVNARLNRIAIKVGAGEVTSEELICIPGCKKIESPLEITGTRNCLVHYILPAMDFCDNLFGFGLRRKLIESADVFSLYQIRVGFFPNYFMNQKGWNAAYSAFKVLINKILTEPDFRFTPKYYTIDLRDMTGRRIAGDSDEFTIIAENYTKNITEYSGLRDARRFLQNHIAEEDLFILPEIDCNLLELEQRTTLIMKEISEEQYEKLLMIVSLLPYSIIYDVNLITTEPKQNAKSIIIDIYTPNNRIDTFYECIQLIIDTLRIRRFNLFQNLVEQDVGTFTNKRVKALGNPYISHHWDKKFKLWRRISYFDTEGKLKSRSEITKKTRAKPVSKPYTPIKLQGK